MENWIFSKAKIIYASLIKFAYFAIYDINLSNKTKCFHSMHRTEYHFFHNSQLSEHFQVHICIHIRHCLVWNYHRLFGICFELPGERVRGSRTKTVLHGINPSGFFSSGNAHKYIIVGLEYLKILNGSKTLLCRFISGGVDIRSSINFPFPLATSFRIATRANHYRI